MSYEPDGHEAIASVAGRKMTESISDEGSMVDSVVALAWKVDGSVRLVSRLGDGQCGTTFFRNGCRHRPTLNGLGHLSSILWPDEAWILRCPAGKGAEQPIPGGKESQ